MPYTKCNSKWIKDLNVRHKMKLLENNISGKFLDTGPGDQFLALTSKARTRTNE